MPSDIPNHPTVETWLPSTMYIEDLPEDLNRLQGLFRMEERVLRRDPTRVPYSEVYIPVSKETFARYKAACAGKTYSPERPNNGKRRKTPDTKRIEVSAAIGRDIYHVHYQLITRGNRIGKAQLPPTPLKGLSPISVVNNIVSLWSTSIAGATTLTPDAEQKAKLEAVINLILHEAHPDRQNLVTPRRRHGDTQIETPLLINTIDRIPDNADDTNFDRLIAGSAVGAFTVLISQRKLTPDLAGLGEIYHRGLLPLSILLQNDGVIKAMCDITGRTKEELCSAVARVEDTQSKNRAALIAQLVNTYDAHLDLVALERLAKETQLLERKAATQPKIPTKSTFAKPEKTPGKSALELKIEATREALDQAGITAGRLILDTTAMSDLFCKKVLRGPNLLPDLSGYEPADQEEKKFFLSIGNTNVWFNGAYTHSRRPIGQIAATGTGLPAQKFHLPSSALPERAARVLFDILNARCVDIYLEAAMAYASSTQLLATEDFDEDFFVAADAVLQVVDKLMALHVNTIRASRDPKHLSSDLVNTDRYWKRLSENPHLIREPFDDDLLIDLSTPEREGHDHYAAMVYHIPFELAPALFANRFVGMGWGLEEAKFDAAISEILGFDPGGHVMQMAQSMRSQFGTSSQAIVERRPITPFHIHSDQSIIDRLRPVAERYDFAFESNGKVEILDTDVLRAIMSDSSPPKREDYFTPLVDDAVSPNVQGVHENPSSPPPPGH